MENIYTTEFNRMIRTLVTKLESKNVSAFKLEAESEFYRPHKYSLLLKKIIGSENTSLYSNNTNCDITCI